MIVMLIINLMMMWCKNKFAKFQVLKFKISYVGNVHSVHSTIGQMREASTKFCAFIANHIRTKKVGFRHKPTPNTYCRPLTVEVVE